MLENEQIIKKLQFDLDNLNEEFKKNKGNNFNKSSEIKNYFPNNTVNFKYDQRAKMDELEAVKQSSPYRIKENTLNASISYNFLQNSNTFSNNLNLYDSSQYSMVDIKKYTDNDDVVSYGKSANVGKKDGNEKMKNLGRKNLIF